MLVLTRKTDGVIYVGDDIVIRVIQTSRGSVKIGIEAPLSTRILRGEIRAFPTETPFPMEAADANALLLQN